MEQPYGPGVQRLVALTDWLPAVNVSEPDHGRCRGNAAARDAVLPTGGGFGGPRGPWVLWQRGELFEATPRVSLRNRVACAGVHAGKCQHPEAPPVHVCGFNLGLLMETDWRAAARRSALQGCALHSFRSHYKGSHSHGPPGDLSTCKLSVST